MERPTWLDPSYVQKVLRKYEKDESIVVSRITVTPAVAKGENYSSIMHRVNVDFWLDGNGRRIHNKNSLIVKSTLEDDAMLAELMELAGYFRTELSMMSETLPRMNEILGSLNMQPLSARCVHVQYEKPTHIFIEDLVPEGFRMANRSAGLDLDHCLLVVREIGRFHAASIALIEKEPIAITKYKRKGFHKDQPPVLANFAKSVAKTFAEQAGKWPELSPRIVEKLNKLHSFVYEKRCQAELYDENDFNVLNHGDLWFNNMMFRYDEGEKPVAHKFVDFQLCNYGSPALDILNFLSITPTNEVRLHHSEVLIREYHNSLSMTMARLECNTKVISFEELIEIMEKRRFCEVFTCLKISIFYSNNPNYCFDSYKRMMIRLLSVYDSKGLLDV